jgi:hypothetical protein
MKALNIQVIAIACVAVLMAFGFALAATIDIHRHRVHNQALRRMDVITDQMEIAYQDLLLSAARGNKAATDEARQKFHFLHAEFQKERQRVAHLIEDE